MAKEVILTLTDDAYAALAIWAGGADQVSGYLQRLVEHMVAHPAQEEQPARRVRAPGLTGGPPADEDDPFHLLAEDQRWGGPGG